MSACQRHGIKTGDCFSSGALSLCLFLNVFVLTLSHSLWLSLALFGSLWLSLALSGSLWLAISPSRSSPLRLGHFPANACVSVRAPGSLHRSLSVCSSVFMWPRRYLAHPALLSVSLSLVCSLYLRLCPCLSLPASGCVANSQRPLSGSRSHLPGCFGTLPLSSLGLRPPAAVSTSILETRRSSLRGCAWGCQRHDRRIPARPAAV